MEETETNAGVHDGRGLVERIREPGEMEDRGMVDSPVLPFVKQGSSRQWFSEASYQAVVGYCLETGW